MSTELYNEGRLGAMSFCGGPDGVESASRVRLNVRTLGPESSLVGLKYVDLTLEEVEALIPIMQNFVKEYKK